MFLKRVLFFIHICPLGFVSSGIGCLNAHQPDERVSRTELNYTAAELLNENPGGGAWGGGFYQLIDFGPIGASIATYASPHDLEVVREALLAACDGPQIIQVMSTLPFRPCDYVLAVAENLPDEIYVTTGRYSFGPGTPYEDRDRSRWELLYRRFGVTRPAAQRVYVYIDETGRDISDEYRRGGGFP